MRRLENTQQIERYVHEYGLGNVLPEELRGRLGLYRFEPDEALCRQGEEPQYIHFLVQGKVKVYTASTDGKTLLVNFSAPLGVIGEIECLSGNEFLNTVTAVTVVETLAVHKRWLAHYDEEASFLRFMLDMVTAKFYSKSIALSQILLYPVEVRLASYLLSVSEENNGGAETGVSIYNLKDAANLIGTSYRHLNRVLREFSHKGLVERGRGTLLVKDRKRLTEVAGRNIYENGGRKQ